MDLMTFFDINHTLVNIPIGGGYAMSWIEAVGTLFGLLCIWFASQEKTINYLFGLINVTLFAVIFYQIQLYGILLLQLFFFCANIYGLVCVDSSQCPRGYARRALDEPPKIAAHGMH